ncbi:MAG: hypothetical protein KDE22_13850 [Rhodobacterales bacterium]|nr:hypothetical protein [Rhodobacterales bacterium]
MTVKWENAATMTRFLVARPDGKAGQDGQADSRVRPLTPCAALALWISLSGAGWLFIAALFVGRT